VHPRGTVNASAGARAWTVRKTGRGGRGKPGDEGHGRAPQAAEHAPDRGSGRKTPKDVEQDWIEGVDYWAGENGDFTEGEYLDFMSYVSAILPEDDEFKLLASELIAG
jgi:hypothetical protein